MGLLEATVCAGDGVKHARQLALHIIVTTVPRFGYLKQGIVRGPAVRGFHTRIFADFIEFTPRQSAQHSSVSRSSAANSSPRCRMPIAGIVITLLSLLKLFRRLKCYRNLNFES